MVKVIQQENKLYQCEECGLKYGEKEIAKKCQAWCKEHKSCNLDIIKRAVQEMANQNTNNQYFNRKK